MPATNLIGHEIQIYINRHVGWVTEHNGFPTAEAARFVLDALEKDGFERRVADTLETHHESSLNFVAMARRNLADLTKWAFLWGP